jgi:hypothetical protein
VSLAQERLGDAGSRETDGDGISRVDRTDGAAEAGLCKLLIW